MWKKTASHHLRYLKDYFPSPLILNSPFSFLKPIRNTSGSYHSSSSGSHESHISIAHLS